MTQTEERGCREKIMEMVAKIKEDKSINMIYGFVKRLYDDSKSHHETHLEILGEKEVL